MKLLSALLSLVLCSAVCSPALAGLNILWYGNSYSGWNGADDTGDSGLPELVEFMAVAAGRDRPNIVGAVVGGIGINYHWAQQSGLIETGLAEGQSDDQWWDVMVMQGQSQEMTDGRGSPDNFIEKMLLFQGALTEHSPGARSVLFETWARAPGSLLYDRGSITSPEQMQSEITANYIRAAGAVNSAFGAGSSSVAPAGRAFAETGWGLDLYRDDLSHPSGRGALLAGLTLYAAIFDTDDLGAIDPGFGDDSSELGARLELLGLGQDDWDELTGVAGAVVPAPGGASVALLVASVATRRQNRRPHSGHA